MTGALGERRDTAKAQECPPVGRDPAVVTPSWFSGLETAAQP